MVTAAGYLKYCSGGSKPKNNRVLVIVPESLVKTWFSRDWNYGWSLDPLAHARVVQW
jgi:hypothetical protein